ncbi:MAG TPA: AMP-binding protein, partial [Candidatus Thermoplasmatota archaeon]|nr:AMP-binding protein [Candidatus Thermoplasmatota archaeon]
MGARGFFVADDYRTLCALFRDAVAKHGDLPAQEWFQDGAWRSRSYREFGQAARDAAHGLLALGVKPGDRVALWSKNSPRWAEVDFADQLAGFVTVPIYDNLTGERGAYILNDSEAKVAFVQDAGVLARTLEVRGSLKHTKTLVLLSGASPEKGVLTYDAFLEAGRAWAAKNPGRLDDLSSKVKPDDLASLVYTSGTTGDPKGAMLTHLNFASNTAALELVKIGPEDVFLSFLPLSHVFERLGGHFAAYRLGAKVVFARSIDTLTDDMQVAHPTIMMSVPRLYEKIHGRLQESVAKSSFVKRRIFAWAIAQGK